METYNGKIIDAREKPIISILEDIRVYVMKRIEQQRKIALKCKAQIMSNIQKSVIEVMKGADKYDAFSSGNSEYQIRQYKYSCDIRERACGCRK